MNKGLTLFFAAAALLAVSCQNKDRQEPVPAQDGKITIRAYFPEETRGSGHLTTGISWTWSSDDIITVIGETTEIFTINDGFTAKEAEFTGNPVKGSKFGIAYPSLDAVDWTAQTQVGNNNIDHLRYVAILDDVDTYSTFTYSPSWAYDHGGSLRQTGVMKFIFTFPPSVTTVSSIELSAPRDIFFVGNDDARTDKLTLNLKSITLAPGETLIGWITTSWNEAAISEGTVLTVTVNAGSEVYTKEVSFISDATLRSGVVNTFTLEASAWSGVEPGGRYSGGSGTEADPWIITNAQQMGYIKEDIVAGDTRYFRLGANIDMTGVAWEPINYAQPYDKRVEFDGAGFTISNLSCNAETYPGLFGVLYGKCYDLTIENAKIIATGNSAGILGGYGGTTGKACEVNNVHVSGTVESSSTVGGLFGSAKETVLNNCSVKATLHTSGGNAGGVIGIAGGDDTITGCSFEGSVSAAGSSVGGIVGYTGGLTEISDCWTAGTVLAIGQLAGGIVGDLRTEKSSVYRCFSGASVTAQFYAGGIVGRANLNSKGNAANNESVDPKNHIEKCIAWNDRIESNATDGNEHYSIGAVVGSTAIKNYLADCFRKPGMTFINCPANAEKGGYGLFDQENASPTTPMVKGSGTYNYAYNGKAAQAGVTISSVAKSLGWSEEIWDLSGSIPGHRNGASWNPGGEGGDQSASGQLPDFELSVFYSE